MSVLIEASHARPLRVAVMQPYLFPYFPYIQLLAGVDVFIIFDTSQYIARGWANRNVIALAEGPHRFVIPVRKAARGTTFSDARFAGNVDAERLNLFSTLDFAYRRAPFAAAPKSLLADTFPVPVAGAPFVEAFERMAASLMKTLSFHATLVRASDLRPREGLTAPDYIVQLVKEVGGSQYLNPIGGRELYDTQSFAAQGVGLSFLQPLPNLGTDLQAGDLTHSILHLLAHHSPADLHRRLDEFRLVTSECASGSDAETEED